MDGFDVENEFVSMPPKRSQVIKARRVKDLALSLSMCRSLSENKMHLTGFGVDFLLIEERFRGKLMFL